MKYNCIQCKKEVFTNLESCYVFERDGLLYLVHEGECIKKFRPDVYDLFEKKRRENNEH